MYGLTKKWKFQEKRKKFFVSDWKTDHLCSRPLSCFDVGSRVESFCNRSWVNIFLLFLVILIVSMSSQKCSLRVDMASKRSSWSGRKYGNHGNRCSISSITSDLWELYFLFTSSLFCSWIYCSYGGSEGTTVTMETDCKNL